MEENTSTWSGGNGNRKTGHLIITDVGSTTTKALLLRRTPEGGLQIMEGIDVPTTVEKPREDVCIGVSAAVSGLEGRTGEKLSRGKGMPGVPYLSTSSAGGGLQMLVFGLTSVETGRIAEMTASNAGGVVLRVISIDDELRAVEKMQVIQNLHPDMIMLAGGTDGGAIAGVVRLAELLSLSNPQPKFRQDMKIPLVYCGNGEAVPFILEVLQDKFDVHVVDNVRPSMEELNMEPARNEVHRLFMDNVMERAPGYSELKSYVISDIIPTPSGVENILRLYGRHTGENVLMIDIGGATTDIFSCITGDYNRTVSANTGMSYSLANVIRRSGMDRLMSHLPESFQEVEVRDYVYSKTINPTYVPSTHDEILIEQAAAICGIDTSWADHLDTCFDIKRIGFLDRMKSRNRRMFEETFISPGSSEFNLSDIHMIIGAGGVISHAGPARAFWMLAEGFRPTGITALSMDRNFRSPHLGVLSQIDEKAAHRLFMEECLMHLGWVVAPFGDLHEGERMMKLVDADTGESRDLDCGDLIYLESGGNLRFQLDSKASLGNGENSLVTRLPVLIDCRNGDREEDSRPISSSGISIFHHSPQEQFKNRIPARLAEPETGEWELEYRLPYSGRILVSPGDEVNPGQVLGENTYAPPQLYIVDLNKIPGYDRHLTPEEIVSGLLVEVGDRIKLNSPLYKVHREGLTGFDFTFHSPVRGMVSRIEESGLIVVREIQDYDEVPHEVDVAGQLGIKPRHVASYMKKKLGDFVEAGQLLASDLSRGSAAMVRSPSTGTIRKIDRKRGTVTVKFDIKPVQMVSNVRGRISRIVEDQAVWVSGSGTRLDGIIGFGSQTSGILREYTGELDSGVDGNTVFFTLSPITAELLWDAEKSGIRGIIAPSIPATDWFRFSGKELGVAITGDENYPFTLVLTSGFGQIPMDQECAGFLRESIGSSVCMSGRTQIRAGVTRPLVIVQ